MPTEVSTTAVTIIQMYLGFIGMKKKSTDTTTQMAEAQINAMRLEPTHRVNAGDTPPNTIQVSSPKVMNTV